MWNIWFTRLAENMLVNFKCKITNCLFTSDLSLLEQSDVVFFNIHTIEDFPVNRQPHQRFVFAQLESPENTKPQLIQMDRFRYNYFNWTMTYRRDSDIFLRDYYGSIVNKATINDIEHSDRYNMKLFNYSSTPAGNFTKDWTQGMDPSLIAIIKGKTKLATWVVSHCPTPVRREEYVRQLQKFVPIDVYGRCSNVSCPGSGSCDEMVRSDYKFYLSFENSWCPDYFTEKFIRGFMFDTVPVVMSGTDYSHFAPRHSYIDARDFSSPKELAKYLVMVAESDYLYAQYFQWKTDYTIDVPDWRGWCDLCRMANDDSLPPKVYPDIIKWWYQDAGECISNTTKYF